MFSFRLDADTELRLLEERHAQELFVLTDQNRAHLRQWLPWLDRVNAVEDTLTFIRSALAQFAANDGFQAGIWHQGRLVGVIGYHRIDWSNRVASIGYWIAEEFQGRGIASRACRALVEKAFGELKLNRVEVVCAAGNRRSQAVPERLGFRREGVMREAQWLYDHYVDHVVYGLLATEWAEQLFNSTPPEASRP